MDHSNGFAFRLNGELWYTPNGSQLVTIPSTTFKMDYWTRLRDLSQPKFFERAWAWRAFIPRYPQYSGYALERLKAHPIVYVNSPRAGYQLEPRVLASWEELEYWLDAISTVLVNLNDSILRSVAAAPNPSYTKYRIIH